MVLPIESELLVSAATMSALPGAEPTRRLYVMALADVESVVTLDHVSTMVSPCKNDTPFGLNNVGILGLIFIEPLASLRKRINRYVPVLDCQETAKSRSPSLS